MNSDSRRDNLTDKLFARARAASLSEEREEILHELIELHNRSVGRHEERARQVRHAVLLLVGDTPQLATQPGIRHFIAEYVTNPDFEGVPWETARQVVAVAEGLYPLRTTGERPASQLRLDRDALIHHALHHFKHQANHEAIAQLLDYAPPPAISIQAQPDTSSTVTSGSRGTSRGQRGRHLLAWLLLLLLLLLLVFPLLMVDIENRSLQQALDETDEIESLEQVSRPAPYSYFDGLSWSLFSASAFGYGEDVPRTAAGTTVARLSTVTKVLVVGVTAQLIHEALRSPRHFEGLRVRSARSRETEEEPVGGSPGREEVFHIDDTTVTLRGSSHEEIAVQLVSLLLAYPYASPDHLAQQALARELARLRRSGWQEVKRTPDAVHLERRKAINKLTLLALLLTPLACSWVLAPLLPLLDPSWRVIAFLGSFLLGLVYLWSREERRVLSL